ncbi:MAG: lipoprotein signal peptidase [Candidatus Hydrogenedentota bacterium]
MQVSQRFKTVLVALIVLVTVGCDQATKHIANTSLDRDARIRVLGDFFVLQYATNTGAFLSLGANLPENVRFWLLTVFTGAVLLVLAYVLWSNPSLVLYDIIAMALLLSGGIGNLIDRSLRNGIVIDFMILSAGPLRTGVFNVADVAVMAGVFLLLGARFFAPAPRKKERVDGPEDA